MAFYMAEEADKLALCWFAKRDYMSALRQYGYKVKDKRVCFYLPFSLLQKSIPMIHEATLFCRSFFAGLLFSIRRAMPKRRAVIQEAGYGQDGC